MLNTKWNKKCTIAQKKGKTSQLTGRIKLLLMGWKRPHWTHGRTDNWMVHTCWCVHNDSKTTTIRKFGKKLNGMVQTDKQPWPSEGNHQVSSNCQTSISWVSTQENLDQSPSQFCCLAPSRKWDNCNEHDKCSKNHHIKISPFHSLARWHNVLLVLCTKKSRNQCDDAMICGLKLWNDEHNQQFPSQHFGLWRWTKQTMMQK